jgi:hypothetical protein
MCTCDSNNVLNCLSVCLGRSTRCVLITCNSVNTFARLIQIPTTGDSLVKRHCNKSYVTNSLVAWSTVFHCICNQSWCQLNEHLINHIVNTTVCSSISTDVICRPFVFSLIFDNVDNNNSNGDQIQHVECCLLLSRWNESLCIVWR